MAMIISPPSKLEWNLPTIPPLFGDPIIVPIPEISTDPRKEAFDREIRALIEQARETIQAKDQNHPDLMSLNRYLKIYNTMHPHEHYSYFENLFRQHRTAILESPTNWLRSGDIAIQFGEDILKVRSHGIRIPLSNIYAMACQLRKTAEDLIRPDIILLHLLRIFYHLIDDIADRDRLAAIITQIEIDLGILERTVPMTDVGINPVTNVIPATIPPTNLAVPMTIFPTLPPPTAPMTILMTTPPTVPMTILITTPPTIPVPITDNLFPVRCPTFTKTETGLWMNITPVPILGLTTPPVLIAIVDNCLNLKGKTK